MAVDNPTFLLAASLSCLCLALGSVTMSLFTRRKNHFPISGRTAIVTGGSQGLGLAIADLLSSRGANVVIVARDVGKLDEALLEVQANAVSPDQRFHRLSFDLTDPSSAPKVLSTVTEWNNGTPPSIVFCCAGNCIPGFFASSSIETLRAQMDTIYWSAAYMAHAALNAWLRSTPAQENKQSTTATSTSTSTVNEDNTRHIILTSSTLAFLPVAGYAPYSPAKAAMKSLADTLSHELAVYNGARLSTPTSPKTTTTTTSALPPPPADIALHTLYPMGILTPGYAAENKLKPALTMMLEKDDEPQTTSDVARIAIERLERGDAHITTNFLGHLMKGVGMAGSVRGGLWDVLMNVVGGIAILFVAPDLVRKCWNWGREKGMQGAR